MNPLRAEPPRRRRATGLLLAVGAALALAPGAAHAVGDDGIYYSRDASDEGAYYASRPSFRIPFGDVDRRIQEVILYVSTDFGRTYTRVTSVAPTAREFHFDATADGKPRDGWFWFAVQTRDADGRLSPPDLGVVQPQIKVCVDTHPPVISYFRWLAAQNGMAGVEWDVADSNLELSTLRVDYRVVGGDWMPLPIKQTANGQYVWNTGTTAAVEARIQVQDKAHNPAEYKTPPSNSAFRPGSTPAVTPAPGPAPAPDAPVSPIMVNTKRIELDFDIQDIGSSKVKAVEVWYTQDGHKWQKTPEDARPEPPYYVNVPTEGRYGFTLIARSGVGLALPAPKDGDQPQVWVEVDTTKPRVAIDGVEVGRGPDSGYITVRWTASDPHMAANAVTISYADAASGASPQWQTITPSPIPNSGRYVWRMPENLPPQILVRVEAADQAGNIGTADTLNAVSTDLSIPKARVRGVHAATADAGTTSPP